MSIPTLAERTAARVSLGALLACLYRETDLVTAEGTTAVLGALRVADGIARCGPGPVGNCTLGGRGIDTAEAFALCVQAMRERWLGQADLLADRTLRSAERMARIVAGRMHAAPATDFQGAEQATWFGHWMHPCPKALTGMSPSEEVAMTPDWQGRLRLHALSVEADRLEATDSAVIRQLPGFDIDPGKGRALLPVHPLTWDRLRDTPAAQGIRDLRPVGPEWIATSSVRTLWHPDSPWQVKISLPVTITNSQRINKRHELLTGPVMARAVAGLPSFGPMRIVTDPHWATLRGDTPETGFEVVFRQNPLRGDAVMQVAGLCAAPLPGQSSLLARMVAGHDPRDWFAAYLDCAVAPLLRMYDRTGIAFEAHQQNALLDLTRGLPMRCDYRDNQGFYVVRDMATPEMRAIPQLTYSRTEAEDALSYTLIVNQVFGVIHRMAADALLPEDEALRMLARHLADLAATLPGHGARLIGRWLRDDHLPAKGNLLTQLGGVDELLIPGERAPQVRVANPLPAFAPRKALVDVA
ncbi:IucA/IucC family protein [Paracoccus sp. PARArs4]|uniref:IucA/IucC family protein n=1 Tax=Paracoccus sp. PARArs4 TaxID=2853442 RepID=UPI0024A61FA7|nr:IucA/IucC family protein [Paracoccus sp. PARArs4]